MNSDLTLDALIIQGEDIAAALWGYLYEQKQLRHRDEADSWHARSKELIAAEDTSLTELAPEKRSS
jgi:hypothetical protein